MTARLAVLEDIGRVAELYRAARDEIVHVRGGSQLLLEIALGEPIEEHLNALCASSEAGVFVGLSAEAIVGLAIIETAPAATSMTARDGRVRLLFVEEQARRRGVGSSLYAYCTEWCRAQGHSGIDVPALPGSRVAKVFLESAGLQARLLVMHRNLGET